MALVDPWPSTWWDLEMLLFFGTACDASSTNFLFINSLSVKMVNVNWEPCDLLRLKTCNTACSLLKQIWSMYLLSIGCFSTHCASFSFLLLTSESAPQNGQPFCPLFGFVDLYRVICSHGTCGGHTDTQQTQCRVSTMSTLAKIESTESSRLDRSVFR